MVIPLDDLHEVRRRDDPVERGTEWLAAVAAGHLAHQERRRLDGFKKFLPEAQRAVGFVLTPSGLQVPSPGVVEQRDGG
ncbi:hypothetical protein D9M71_695370 [compost metagenome]